MIKKIILILFFGVVFSKVLIVDEQNVNSVYSDDEFIELLELNPIFSNDEDFLNYKKYVNRLKFNKSKYIYILSLGSIATGIDGLQNPEQHLEEESPPGVKNIIAGILLSSTYYGYNKMKKNKSLYNVIQKYNSVNLKEQSNHSLRKVDEIDSTIKSFIDNYNQVDSLVSLDKIHIKNQDIAKSPGNDIVNYSNLEKESNTATHSTELMYDKNEPIKWDKSFTYGLLSEKIPVSFIEVSGLLNISDNSEYYFAIGSMLFGSGVGFGYKYYVGDKLESSPFISFGTQVSHLGTSQEGMTIYGVSISPGFSKIYKSDLKLTYRETFAGDLKEVNYKKTSMNFGVSFMYLGDKSAGIFPFINIERRF